MPDTQAELRIYKDTDGSQHPDTIAMSIVYNLGDAFYDQLRGKVNPRDFAKARIATNDDFIDHAIKLITDHTNQILKNLISQSTEKKVVSLGVKGTKRVVDVSVIEDLIKESE